MPRSITDEEIGLIKAMLAHGERNVDIQFYFNRQDRPVNSGRISQIRSGTYGPQVPQANENLLAEFLRTFEAAQIGVAMGANGEANRQPTIAERAASRFRQRDGNWFLADGETTQQECKEVFDPTRMNSIIKAIAALANNKGGFVFFGIENANCRVIGLPDRVFSDTDIVRISDKVKTFLTPTPDFIKETIEIGGMTVGVIYVEKYDVPPVIVSRDGEGLNDGSILFRYPGQSAKIKFGDLLAMLRERDQASQSNLLKSAQRISEIGTDRSLIIDTSAGILDTGDMHITIDRKLADQLEFIREGDFEEIEGAPALKLVGDVKAVDAEGAVHERIEGHALTADSVLEAFFRKEQVRTPFEYIRVSLLVQRQWLPIFFFAQLCNETAEEISVRLAQSKAVYANSKTKMLTRLSGELSAFVDASGQAIPVLDRIIRGDIAGLDNEYEDKLIARAMQAIPEGFANLDPVLELLEQIFERAEGNSALLGLIFKASARLDELAYKAAN